MSRADIREKEIAYAWLLEIAGLPHRYYSGQRPPAKSIGWGGVEYTDLPFLASIGSQTAEYSALGGVAEMGGMTVTVKSSQGTEPAYDPAVVLMRNGRRMSSRAVRLAETLPHDNVAVDVVLNRDVAGWPTIGGREVFHCGVETLVAQGGTDTSPPRFIAADRAMLGTRVDEHIYDAALGWQPWVTSEIVTWKGRRVRLLRAAITGAPLVEDDYEEVLRGELDRPPQRATNGSVQVGLAPLTVALKKKVGGDSVITGLVTTHHLYTRGIRSTIAHTQVFARGAMMKQQNVAMGDAAGSGKVRLNASNASMADNTDPTLALGHPRRSHFQVSDSVAKTMAADGAAPFAVATEIAVGVGFPTANTNGGGVVENVDLWDVHAVDLCGGADEAVLEWPQGVEAAVNAAWNPGTVAGASGAWADVKLVLSGDRPRVEVLRNGTASEGPLQIEFRSDWGEPGLAAKDYFRRQGYIRHRAGVATLGIDFAAPDETRWQDNGERWTRVVVSSHRRGANQAPQRFDLRGVAIAIYEAGERYFLARSNVLGTISGVKWVLITWTDPRGEQRRQTLPIIAVTAEIVGGKTIGYRYEIGETHRQQAKAFGDWPGNGTRCQIRAAAMWSEAPAAQVLLELLLSGRGNSINSGGYDRQAFGANLNEDDVWIETFLSAPDVGPWTRPLAEEVQIGQWITPILQAMGCALAMVLDEATGMQRLALVHLGLEFAPDSAKTLTAAHASGGVGGPVQAAITTTYKIEAGYNEADDKPTLTPTYVDADAKGDAGGDAGEALKLELKGLVVRGATDGAALALALASDLRARYGRPRLTHQITTYHGAHAGLGLGKVVRLALPEAQAVGRVVKTSIDHDRQRATLGVVVYGVNGAGWHKALKVSAVISPTVVEVEANAFTRDRHPITGQPQADLDYWAVNDPCACVKRGQWAARVQTSISAINSGTRRVTFAANHLLAVGDTIRPRAYDDSTAEQKGFLYVADADDTLGAAGDRAKDWM